MIMGAAQNDEDVILGWCNLQDIDLRLGVRELGVERVRLVSFRKLSSSNNQYCHADRLATAQWSPVTGDSHPQLCSNDMMSVWLQIHHRLVISSVSVGWQVLRWSSIQSRLPLSNTSLMLTFMLYILVPSTRYIRRLNHIKSWILYRKACVTFRKNTYCVWKSPKHIYTSFNLKRQAKNYEYEVM